MDIKLKKFILKYAIISSVIIWTLGSILKDFTSELLDCLVLPFFSLDLNNDGIPDMIILNQMKFNLFGTKLPIGKILFLLIKTILELILIYIIIYSVINYTNLINL